MQLSPLLVLLPLTGIILARARAVNIDTGRAALQSVSGLIVLLFLGALLDLLPGTIIGLLATGTLLLVRELYIAVTRGPVTIPVPLGLFLVLSAMFWLAHWNNQYFFYDEYAHWGIFLKEMQAAAGLWGGDTNSLHPRYPPGSTLWQYFFTAYTRQTDGAAYLAQFTLLITPLLVLWSSLTWRRVGWIAGILAAVALLLANYGHWIASNFVDHVLATWFAGTILCFILDRRDGKRLGLLVYALPLTVLPLLKDVGLFFALCAAGIMATLTLRTVSRRGSPGVSGSVTPALCALLISAWVIAPVGASSLWSWNRDLAGAPADVMSVGGILSGLLDDDASGVERAEPRPREGLDGRHTPIRLGHEQRADVKTRFARVMFHQQIAKNRTSIEFHEFSEPVMGLYTDKLRLTTVSLLALFVVWQLVLNRWLLSGEGRWTWGITGAGLLATCLAYIFILYLSYQFAFGLHGLKIPSYIRYANTALLPLLIMALAPLLPATYPISRTQPPPEGRGHPRRLPLAFSLVLCALYLFETPYFAPFYRDHPRYPMREKAAASAEVIRKEVGDGRLWVFYPWQDGNGFLGWLMKFQLTPVRTDIERDPSVLELEPGELLSLLRQYDYVWFPVSHSRIDAMIATLPGADAKGRLYRVVTDGGLTRLQGVESGSDSAP